VVGSSKGCSSPRAPLHPRTRGEAPARARAIDAFSAAAPRSLSRWRRSAKSSSRSACGGHGRALGPSASAWPVAGARASSSRSRAADCSDCTRSRERVLEGVRTVGRCGFASAAVASPPSSALSPMAPSAQRRARCTAQQQQTGGRREMQRPACTCAGYLAP
jgi:hypothetical protein